MANDPQDSKGSAWEDASLVDMGKLHTKFPTKYNGVGRNSETVILKDEAIHWDKDDYAILFKERKVQNFHCETNRSKLTGFGPWCEFQDIGRGQEHQCLFDERRKCIADYVDALQAFPPRGPWNNLNSRSEADQRVTGRTAYRLPLDSIAATQARAEWQKSGTPPFNSPPCSVFLVDQEATLCDEGKSGVVSIKAIQKALAKCFAAIEKKCQCQQCDELPDDEETYDWDDGEDKPDNDTDDPTDDDGDPAPGIDRQSTTLSSHEMPIPVTFGRVQVKGNIIWVGGTETEEVTYVEPLTPDTDKVPEVVTKTVLTGSIAIGLCKGEIKGISKIVFGKRVVYRAALPTDFDPYDVEVENTKSIYGQLEGIVETAKRVTFEVFQGEAAARINPVMAAIDGVDRTPAYRDLAYLFITNLPISEFARDGLPNITVEVYTRAKAGEIASLRSTPLPDTTMTTIDPEFLALDVANDRLYTSGGNPGPLTHGIRMFNWRNLVEVKQMAPTTAVPSSMALSRDNIVIYQEREIERARAHWYSVDYGMELHAHGANSAGEGHEEEPGSLGAWARAGRGPAIMTAVSYASIFELGRSLAPIEYQLFPSKFDDLARYQQRGDTRLIYELSGSRVLGYPDGEPSICFSSCFDDYHTSCVDYCTYLANIDNLGSGECTYEPDNITVSDRYVYNIATETIVGELDRIDSSGNIFVVGNPTPVAVQDCSSVIPPGDPLPPDPTCITSCDADGTAYCTDFCGSGTRIIEATFEAVRPTISGSGDGSTETERGAIIAYRPYSTAPYSSMTSLTLEWLTIGSTESDMAVDLSFLPENYRTLGMDLWGNNPSSILAQVINIPGGAEHVYFIKTLAGPDYAFRYNHVTEEVVWQRALPSRLPSFYSANERKVEYPNTDYAYIGATGDIVMMELAEGGAEIIGTIGGFSLPTPTGAQLYDPRDRGITYIAGGEAIRCYPDREVIDDVSLAEIAAGIFELCGIQPHQYDVSALADTRVIGYVVEDIADAKNFLTQIRELFNLRAVDGNPIRFAPPTTTGVATVTAEDARLSAEQEFVETRKWQDRQFTDVIVVSLTNTDYATVETATAKVDDYTSAYSGQKRFETKFYFYHGQAESLAELYLMNNKTTRGELAITLGPQHARLAPGDVFDFAGRDGVARTYVIDSTYSSSLPNTMICSTIEQIDPLTIAQPVAPVRSIKPLRKPVLIFTNAINDVDARALVSGNQIVYAGIESPQESFAPREIFGFGRRRLTDTGSFAMARTSSVRWPAVGKSLHSGSGPVLTGNARLDICDRTTALTVTFDRDASIDAMSNATEIDVINDPTRNLLIYDGEQIQFLNVERVSPRVARFTNIYRGRNGTEIVKDLIRDEYAVRVYYYTPDTFVSAVVTNNTYAGRPWVDAVIGDTAVGRDWHVPARYMAYDYGSRLWAPAHAKGTKFSTTADYAPITFEWVPRSPLTERENTEFTAYLSEERYRVFIMSGFPNGEIPIDEFDSGAYRNSTSVFRYASPIIVGQRTYTIPEEVWRLIPYNHRGSPVYFAVAQIHPVTGAIGLPGIGIVPR